MSTTLTLPEIPPLVLHLAPVECLDKPQTVSGHPLLLAVVREFGRIWNS
jgi:hypothetical protein